MCFQEAPSAEALRDSKWCDRSESSGDLSQCKQRVENITSTVLDGLVLKCMEVIHTLRFSE